MGITHVLRADEWLSSTPRHVLLYQALGWEPPLFAHLPMILGPDKSKLSKRHGATAVTEFQEQGYLPEAMLNFLALLGWSLDDRTEHFTRDELVKAFSLDRVNKAPAGFDPRKLMAFQARHFQLLPPQEKVEQVLPFLLKAGYLRQPVGPPERARVEQVVAAAGDRIKVAGDVLFFDEFFVADDRLAYDEKAFRKRVRAEGAPELLRKFRGRLAAAEPFEAAVLEQLLNDFVAEEGIKVGQVIHAVRVAVTGKAVGLGLFETLAILGRTACLRRLDRTLEQA
jgi:glutamyl-tRNA synthetase